jgi:uncharacterized membrane protein YdjX (TVP38/TMEM64 family)
MNWNKKKVGSLLTAVIALIVLSPLDDIAVAAVFGGAILGFGSVSFYVLIACSSAVSVAFWLRRKHVKQAITKTRLQLPQYRSLA